MNNLRYNFRKSLPYGLVFLFTVLVYMRSRTIVETAKQLVQWCLAKSKPPRLLTASAVGIYGSFTDASLAFNRRV